MIEAISQTDQQSSSTEYSERIDGLMPAEIVHHPLHLKMYGMNDRAKVLLSWRELEQRLPSVPIACSAAWTENWLQQYGDIVRPWFVVATANGVIEGVCLLSESNSKLFGIFPVKTLNMGTAGEPHGQSVCVEYNELLVSDHYREKFVYQLQKLIASERGWDQFVLSGISAKEGTSWPILSDQYSDMRDTSTRIRECRYFDLKACRDAGEEILQRLGKSTKSNLKRRSNQLDPLAIDWAESTEQALEIFEELIKLHQARWQAVGMPGAFASDRFKQFLRTLIEKTFANKGVVLARITSKGKTIGCLYLLNDRNRLLDYVSGFVSFEEAPSPGLMSHYVCMQEAMKRGYDAYDFLVGEKQHKANLGKSAQQLQWIICERRRLKYCLRDAVQYSKQIVKKFLKRDTNKKP
ncbi:GNAT family N-acetyltransferase [Rubinisphaera italica]|uniref:BioF2-like acetyltransferase domain-containing protein n=1 Tax=Rubinisphaera italica TaxID=2527969 RepID=A0A5C5XBS0_9PLAN|nr:GNAT family N-acetyltransferase [Rubinisphaera italica]TWT60204.1 hypothetical protein Pan54_09180 [Rubinisphaera italica]